MGAMKVELKRFVDYPEVCFLKAVFMTDQFLFNLGSPIFWTDVWSKR